MIIRQRPEKIFLLIPNTKTKPKPYNSLGPSINFSKRKKNVTKARNINRYIYNNHIKIYKGRK